MPEAARTTAAAPQIISIRLMSFATITSQIPGLLCSDALNARPSSFRAAAAGVPCSRAASCAAAHAHRHQRARQSRWAPRERTDRADARQYHVAQRTHAGAARGRSRTALAELLHRIEVPLVRRAFRVVRVLLAAFATAIVLILFLPSPIPLNQLLQGTRFLRTLDPLQLQQLLRGCALCTRRAQPRSDVAARAGPADAPVAAAAHPSDPSAGTARRTP